MKLLIDNALSPRPEKQIAVLLDRLPSLAETLAQGSIVVFDGEAIRIRQLR